MKAATLSQAIRQFDQVMNGVVCVAHGEPVGIDLGIAALLEQLGAMKAAGRSVWMVGNGGSAAVASHIINDLVNKSGIRAHVLHEPSLLTCMSNDFGYDVAYARLVGHFVSEGDMLIAISSGGKSPNILGAVEAARKTGASVVTFSGFGADNPLRTLGEINFWSPSSDYGEVEISHAFLLHYIADSLAGR